MGTAAKVAFAAVGVGVAGLVLLLVFRRPGGPLAPRKYVAPGAGPMGQAVQVANDVGAVATAANNLALLAGAGKCAGALAQGINTSVPSTASTTGDPSDLADSTATDDSIDDTTDDSSASLDDSALA